MASLILDERDQQFVLHEMLNIEGICQGKYADFSRSDFDMILSEAKKFAQAEIYPILADGDRQGCRLVGGRVRVPEAFHKPYRLYCDAGWLARRNGVEHGGQGMPETISLATDDWFFHNFSFTAYAGLASGAAELIELYGTDEQKKKYLPNMLSGRWGGTMCLTEPEAGSDVGALTSKAVRQKGGTFKVQGTKCFISCADSDLVENVIHAVLARIEGDPDGTKGISIFIVPKYLVNEDGSLGARNDLEVTKVEEKMGLHGKATCMMSFGDNNACHAELLGGERTGMKIMFNMMNASRMGVGVQGLAGASFCYLHALQYSKERVQGSSLDGKRKVAIIRHPDVRRMLLWMKTQVESMRALIYYTGSCRDRGIVSTEEKDRERWTGLEEVLTPICKAYCSDMAFRVCETAIQIYGGYGFCSDYPIEQILRDEKIGSIYEGTNGIQALDLLFRKLEMKNGACFSGLLKEMRETVAGYGDGLEDLAHEMQAAIDTLADTVAYFKKCGEEKKHMVPFANAYPFLMMMGKIICAWLLFWQAGIAREKLVSMGVAVSDRKAMAGRCGEDREAAFCAGKLYGARYFIRNVLPEVYATKKAIRHDDLSIMEIADESFAT